MVFIAMATTSVCQRKGSAGALRFLRTVSQSSAEHTALRRAFIKRTTHIHVLKKVSFPHITPNGQT